MTFVQTSRLQKQKGRPAQLAPIGLLALVILIFPGASVRAGGCLVLKNPAPEAEAFFQRVQQVVPRGCPPQPRCPPTPSCAAGSEVNTAYDIIAKMVTRRLAAVGRLCPDSQVLVRAERDGLVSARVTGSALDADAIRQRVLADLELDGVALGEFELLPVARCMQRLTPIFHVALSATDLRPEAVSIDDITGDEELRLPTEKECAELGSLVQSQLRLAGLGVAFWVRRDDGAIAVCHQIGLGFEIKDLNVDRERAVKLLRGAR